MQVDKYKRVIVGPGAQVVSAGGYTMGGGHSPLSPALGLAVDNVLEIQVLCSILQVRYFSPTVEEMLFP